MSYKHDYNLTPDFHTPRIERSLHQDHSFAMNEARDYINEFKNLDYEDFMGIGRVKYMLQRNVFEFRNKATRNIVERVGARLKELPCQDQKVENMTQSVRNLWKLLMCAGIYYKSAGQTRTDNRKKFYEILIEFRSSKQNTVDNYGIHHGIRIEFKSNLNRI